MNMLYAGSKLALVTKVSFVENLFCAWYNFAFAQIGLQHVFEVRELEELTEEWLVGKLVRGYSVDLDFGFEYFIAVGKNHKWLGPDA